MTTFKYKLWYKIVIFVQMISSVILLILQVLWYKFTLIESITDQILTSPTAIFFLYFNEFYLMMLAILMLVFIGEILEWFCGGCKFNEC